MKTKRADINVSFRHDGRKVSIDTSAVVDGGAMSPRERDAEMAGVLMMVIFQMLGDIGREDFLRMCEQAYASNRNTPPSGRVSFVLPADGMGN